MSTYLYAVNNEGTHIFDNFPSEAKFLITDYKNHSEKFQISLNGSRANARLGKKTNEFGTIYVLTTEPKYVNRLKFFKQLIELSAHSLQSISQFQQTIVHAETAKSEELIHNITSLNTYSIQDLFVLIPQKTLSENINTQKETIKNIIIEKPNVTVDTLLKLIKYNLAMKVEFSVFERTQKPNSIIKKISHSIRGLVLSILQIFIDDFEKKKIEVSLDAGTASERRIEIDDDSLFVSLFYILENSLKYCCPSTKYKIIFKDEGNLFSIIFIMISIRIEKHETEKLTNFGYRSETAKVLNTEGKGIGMYRIVKTLKLNNAELEITPRINEYTRKVGNTVYEGNQFKIIFKDQKDWFR